VDKPIEASSEERDVVQGKSEAIEKTIVEKWAALIVPKTIVDKEAALIVAQQILLCPCWPLNALRSS